VSDPTLGFTHRYQPGATPDSPTFLMLHGTGGGEEDLLPLGPMLSPGAALLSPRGKVLERGMPRFFRRLAEGVFDVDDLRVRTNELAQFVAEAAGHYGFHPNRVYGVGFSNGANIAASLLLLSPGTLAGAILFRAMVPIVPDLPPDLTGTAVLLSNGSQDPIVPRDNADRLAGMLRAAGAEVTQVWQPAGHELTHRDVSTAREWCAGTLAPRTR
jgi:phospholipase/carboxylesterase